VAKEQLCAMIDKILLGTQTHIVAQLKCADWLSEAGYYDRAQNLLDDLEAKFKGYHQFHYTYGWHLHRQKHYAEAAAQFRKVLAKQPQHQMALEGLGRALRDLANQAAEIRDLQTAKRYRKEAEGHFKSAVKVAKKLKISAARFYAARGWLYYDWGRFGEALEDFKMANQQGYHFMSGWGEGAALVALKKYHKALAALRKALESAPQPLDPPASDEIPRLITDCEKALSSPTNKSQPPP
jgi:tetratricopeptide (TPR) repeat protein